MSLIIEDELFVIQKKQLPKGKINGCLDTNLIKKFSTLHEINNKNFQTFAFFASNSGQNKTVKLVIPFKKRIFHIFDLWYSVQIDHNSLCRQQKFSITKDQLPFHIYPFKKKLEAIREIHRSRQSQPKFFKVYINQNGSIQCILPKIVLNENLATTFKLNTKKSSKNPSFLNYVQNMVKLLVTDTNDILKSIFNRLCNYSIQQETIMKQNQKEIEQNFLKFQLFRYLARSSIQLRFDCTEGSALYEQVVNITITEEKEIQERIDQMKQANLFKMKTLSLYTQFNDVFQKKGKQTFYMSAKQKQMTKNLLQIPQILPIKQGFGPNNPVLENKYMFNSIILELPHENQKLNFLGQSGFGQIEFGTFNFWYLNNAKIDRNDIEQCIISTHKVKNKYLVVKSPKQTNDPTQRRKYQGKQMHEIEIVNRLKGLSCALIPRFYKVENFYPEAFTDVHKTYIKKYQNALMIELTSCYGQPGYNLGNLIEDRWLCLTLKKVIYIMSQVAQALRFLHLNKIVHLDLKPQNILFLKNFTIKLIDFGQAYHPLVPYEDTTPAYTYPYGCPQIAQQCQSFSDKSDVFSFGIILYELLYGRDLITTSPQNLVKQLRAKTYCQKILFNPEQLLIYGENLILPMLNHLIIKSLSPDIDLRPSITWISVLLKNYLEILP